MFITITRELWNEPRHLDMFMLIWILTLRCWETVGSLHCFENISEIGLYALSFCLRYQTICHLQSFRVFRALEELGQSSSSLGMGNQCVSLRTTLSQVIASIHWVMTSSSSQLGIRSACPALYTGQGLHWNPSLAWITPHMPFRILISLNDCFHNLNLVCLGHWSKLKRWKK